MEPSTSEIDIPNLEDLQAEWDQLTHDEKNEEWNAFITMNNSSGAHSWDHPFYPLFKTW